MSKKGPKKGEGKEANMAPLNLSKVDSNSGNGIDTLLIEKSESNMLIKVHQPIQTPRSELGDALPLTHSVSSMTFHINDDLQFDLEPYLIDSRSTEEYNMLFDAKCKQCEQICNWKDDLPKCEEKTQILQELLLAVQDTTAVASFTSKEYSALFSLFTVNCIRPTPNVPAVWFCPACIDFSTDKMEEIGWPHMQQVYTILLTFLKNGSFNSKKATEDAKALIQNVMPLFSSPDYRERAMLTPLYHVLYRNYTQFRPLARAAEAKYLSDVLLQDRFSLGAKDILQASASIIAGFKVPLSQTHLMYYQNILLPLHRSANIYKFHQELVQCVYAFSDKNPSLANRAIEELFNCWPSANPTKSLLFLREIEALAVFLITDLSKDLVIRFTPILARCITDTNFAVAERALLMWESDSFSDLIKCHSKIVFPKILPAIFRTARSHWCQEVQVLALQLLKFMKGLDETTFNNVGSKMRQKETKRVMAEMERGLFWSDLARACGDTDAITQVSKLFVGCESVTKKKFRKSI